MILCGRTWRISRTELALRQAQDEPGHPIFVRRHLDHRFPEVDNALNQARKEVGQRYDFKGARAEIELNPTEKTLTLTADDEIKMNALWEIVQTRLVRRGVPVKNFKAADSEPAAGGTVRRVITIQQGIPIEAAREIVKFIKDKKLKKVQAVDSGRSGARELAVEGRTAGSDARSCASTTSASRCSSETGGMSRQPHFLLSSSSPPTPPRVRFGIRSRITFDRRSVFLSIGIAHLVGDLFLRRRFSARTRCAAAPAAFRPAA